MCRRDTHALTGEAPEASEAHSVDMPNVIPDEETVGCYVLPALYPART
jgi:hypothetical protein